MFVVHTQTVKGPFTIGFVNTTLVELERAFNPLVNLLASMTDPVVVNQSIAYASEAPDDTDATLKFEYLGFGESDFASEAELAMTINQFLARDIFPCVISMTVAGGRVSAEFESFQLLSTDDSIVGLPPIH